MELNDFINKIKGEIIMTENQTEGKVKGIITRIFDNPNKTGKGEWLSNVVFVLDGKNRYSTLKTPDNKELIDDFKVNDHVEIEYKIARIGDKSYRNIVNMTLLTELPQEEKSMQPSAETIKLSDTEGQKSPELSFPKREIRQIALQAAVVATAAQDIGRWGIETVGKWTIELAKEFEKFVGG